MGDKWICAADFSLMAGKERQDFKAGAPAPDCDPVTHQQLQRDGMIKRVEVMRSAAPDLPEKKGADELPERKGGK